MSSWIATHSRGRRLRDADGFPEIAARDAGASRSSRIPSRHHRWSVQFPSREPHTTQPTKSASASRIAGDGSVAPRRRSVELVSGLLCVGSSPKPRYPAHTAPIDAPAPTIWVPALSIAASRRNPWRPDPKSLSRTALRAGDPGAKLAHRRSSPSLGGAQIGRPVENVARSRVLGPAGISPRCRTNTEQRLAVEARGRPLACIATL